MRTVHLHCLTCRLANGDCFANQQSIPLVSHVTIADQNLEPWDFIKFYYFFYVDHPGVLNNTGIKIVSV